MNEIVKLVIYLIFAFCSTLVMTLYNTEGLVSFLCPFLNGGIVVGACCCSERLGRK